jgi:hypothetical protein
MQSNNSPSRRSPAFIWWCAWIFVALLWIAQAFDGFDWGQLILGFLTGCLLALWAMEMKGDNEVPSWMVPHRKRSVRK